MTPSPLRPESVLSRLQEMERLLEVLEGQRSVTGEDLRADLRERLVAERALQQLVDLAVKVNAHIATTQGLHAPGDYYSTFAAAAEAGALDEELAATLAPSTGLRNRLVHEYERIDLDAVAAGVVAALDGYSQYVQQVAAWLDDQIGEASGRDG